MPSGARELIAVWAGERNDTLLHAELGYLAVADVQRGDQVARRSGRAAKLVGAAAEGGLRPQHDHRKDASRSCSTQVNQPPLNPGRFSPE